MSAERYYLQRRLNNMENGLSVRSHYCASCFRENTVEEARSIIVIGRAVLLI
jgi:hypothetical protein